MIPQNVNPYRQFAPSDRVYGEHSNFYPSPQRQFAPSDQVYGEHSNFYPPLQRSPHSMYFQQYGNDRSLKRDVMLGFLMGFNC